MKKIVNSKKILKKIRNITFVLLIIAAGFIVFDETRLIGSILLLILLITEWRLYRCPNCNKTLDPRINIDTNIYCPYCGKKI